MLPKGQVPFINGKPVVFAIAGDGKGPIELFLAHGVPRKQMLHLITSTLAELVRTSTFDEPKVVVAPPSLLHSVGGKPDAA